MRQLPIVRIHRQRQLPTVLVLRLGGIGTTDQDFLQIFCKITRFSSRTSFRPSSQHNNRFVSNIQVEQNFVPALLLSGDPWRDGVHVLDGELGRLLEERAAHLQRAVLGEDAHLRRRDDRTAREQRAAGHGHGERLGLVDVVAKELRAYAPWVPQEDLFAATPPSEAKKILFYLLSQKG